MTRRCNIMTERCNKASVPASILAPRLRGPDPAERILLRLSLRRRPIFPKDINPLVSAPPPGRRKKKTDTN